MKEEAREMPGLGLSLSAMTALQALVALALFAPGVLAPAAGISPGALALFSGACFAVGMPAALFSARLIHAMGSFGTAAFCMLVLALAMACMGMGGTAALLIAGALTGLAFGPETPASSALLGRVASERQRPLVFSVRQTGNQIGAIAGSLVLPFLVQSGSMNPYHALIGLFGVALLAYALLEHRFPTRIAGRPPDLAAGLALMRANHRIATLALASAPLSAMQLGLNAFFVTLLTGEFGVAHAMAGLALGVAQAGGLAGRLGWGVVVQRFLPARRVLFGLALGMTLLAMAIAVLPAGTGLVILFPLAFLFGLTASGWNGIFLAEIAALAPHERIADVTGAVLVASYAGLLAAPLLISSCFALGGMRLAYLALALLALGAAQLIARNDHARA